MYHLVTRHAIVMHSSGDSQAIVMAFVTAHWAFSYALLNARPGGSWTRSSRRIAQHSRDGLSIVAAVAQRRLRQCDGGMVIIVDSHL
eukprot:SAG11_NODE_184_length_13162_cov_9.151803_13_plen_87_part_00